MKRNQFFLMILMVLSLFIHPKVESSESLEAEVVHRMYFQNIEDGMRFTGCVLVGGMCYAPEETVVQDCLNSDGKWVPCGWE